MSWLRENGAKGNAANLDTGRLKAGGMARPEDSNL